jgi:hypothetical protein
MSKAKLLSVQRVVIGKTNRFIVEMKVRQVTRDLKYPEGIKVNMSLVDTERSCLRLLVDNHAPFGFHIHHRLPENHSHREPLRVSNFEEAADYFIKLAERIVDEEE